MPHPATSTPRWYALPLLALGAAGFAAAWMLLALALNRQCAWLAPLAALDLALLLRLAKWPAGRSRQLWALLGTTAVIAAANLLIAAGQVGQSFGLRPWESALRIGPGYAWLLAGMANDGLDLLFYAAALAVAWRATRSRSPRPS